MKRTEAGSALLLTGLASDKAAHLSDSQFLPLPGELSCPPRVVMERITLKNGTAALGKR